MSVQTKLEKVRQSIDDLKEYAISGELQPHEAYALIKEGGLDAFLKDRIDKVRGEAVDVLRNNFIEPGKKSFKDNTYQYTIRAGSTRYYFTDIEEYQKVSAELKTSEAFKKVKEVEQKYKTAFLMRQKNQIMVDEETGEVIDPSQVNVVYNPDSLVIKKLN